MELYCPFCYLCPVCDYELQPYGSPDCFVPSGSPDPDAFYTGACDCQVPFNPVSEADFLCL